MRALEGLERLNMLDREFYKGRRVLVTGHTGFKGSWLCRILKNAGAEVYGYALEPPAGPSLFNLVRGAEGMTSKIGDVRDFDYLYSYFKEAKPEVVFHLAAQPIVRESYKDPRGTYETNVMGTVNVLECCRLTPSVKSVLNVTTDKVYLNDDLKDHAFKEDEPLDGYDPYSNSKSCSELVTHSYKKSYFDLSDCAVSTARAGNVIGGGDFAADRIIPDCVRAAERGEALIVRNPYSTRPYQHVLEPLSIYLEIAARQYKDKSFAGYYNVGPDEIDCVTTGELVSLFAKAWGEGFCWENRSIGGPHEAAFLKLDNTKIKRVFGWKPRWHIGEAVEKTVEWTKVYLNSPENIPFETDREIEEYLNE